MVTSKKYKPEIPTEVSQYVEHMSKLQRHKNYHGKIIIKFKIKEHT